MIVDPDTIFSTLIVQGSEALPHVEPYPQPIMKYTEAFYRPVFGGHGDFKLRENGERPKPHQDTPRCVRMRQVSLLT